MSQRKKKGRDISGILILDKPLNISSNHAVQRVKRLYDAKKVGHTGSLDPLASGVLPVCLGHATKVSSYLLASDKAYQFTMKLGQTTATGDVEGEVVDERKVPDISLAELDSLISEYTGAIKQVPPMYSALKHNGQRLYALAREGKIVERPSRDVTIKSLKLISKEAEFLTFETLCTKGTYIRTLAEDLGKAIGCGAHVTFLRRLQTGPFHLTKSVTLSFLESLRGDQPALNAQLLSLDTALLDYPAVCCDEKEKSDLGFGRQVKIPGLQEYDLVRLNDQEGKIFGLGKYADTDQLAPVKIFI